MADTLFDLMPELYRHRDRKAGGALEALLGAVESERRRIASDIDGMYRNWFAETADEDGLRALAPLLGIPPHGVMGAADIADLIACQRRKGAPSGVMRRIAARTGWIARVADVAGDGASHRATRARVEVWRRPVYRTNIAAACPLGRGHYAAHPFGVSTPLFAAPEPRYDIDAPFRDENAPRALETDTLDHLRVWRIDRDAAGAVADIAPLTPRPLPQWRTEGDRRDLVFVAPERGRLFYPAGDRDRRAELWLEYGYEFGGPVGAGPYQPEERADCEWEACVSTLGLRRDSADANFTDLAEALRAWRRLGGAGRIIILDSGAYALGPDDWPDGTSGACGGGLGTLTVAAASGEVPTIRGEVEVRGFSAALSGLMLDAGVRVANGAFLGIERCTINPMRADIAVEVAHGALGLEFRRTICGAIGIAETAAPVKVRDSIIQPKAGAALTGRIEGAHLAYSTALSAPAETRTEPDSCVLTSVGAADVDATYFESTVLGQPGYCQLAADAPPDLRSGAPNGSERGAFNFLMRPQREFELRQTLREYIPAGVAADVVFRS